MAIPLDSASPTAVGENVLTKALANAVDTWGERLLAAYALGSLAHGGFSIHVSDVDLGLILSDPIEDRDAAGMADLFTVVKASEAPLADRLSVFWGSLATLSGQAPGGRFPPLDRLDLKRYGRLLTGQDIRGQFPSPTIEELVVVGAEFALNRLANREVMARLKDPEALAVSDVKTLTKEILYPVRFFFTANTGEVGMNDLAVEHFVASTTGPAAQLAQMGLEWRHAPPDPKDPVVVRIIEEGLLPLYRLFLDDYEPRLTDYGRPDLAAAFRDWREQLEAP